MKRGTVEPMAVPGKSCSPGSWREAPQWSAEMEGELVRLVESRGPAVAKAFAQRVFGIHPKAVDRRLRRLIPDLVRRMGHAPAGDRWEEGEGERLAGLLEGTATLKSIAQRISNLNLREPVRSAAAVRSKLWRSEREIGLPGFKATEVAEMLGVQERQVKRWTHNGYLETKAGRISEGSLEDLLKNRPHLVPFQWLDKEQQELLLCLGYRSKQEQGKHPARLRVSAKQIDRLLMRAGEKITQRETAMLMGVSVRQVRHWIERGWLRGHGEISIENLRELVRLYPGLLDAVPDRVRRRITGADSNPQQGREAAHGCD